MESGPQPLGSEYQCSVTVKCFLMYRQNLLCFSLCLLPPTLSLGTTENSLVPSSVYPWWWDFLWAFYRLSSSSSLSISSYERCFSPFILTALHWTLSSSCIYLCTSPCGTSSGSWQSFSLSCWGSSAWQHDPMTYQPALQVLCHLQTCRGCISPYPH